LLCKAQHIERLRSFSTIESTEGHIAFRPADQSIAECHQLCDMGVAVLPAAFRFIDKVGERAPPRYVDLGQALVLSDETEVQAQPRITCLEAGCLTVWADDTHGAQAAMIDAQTGEVSWRKNFAAADMRYAKALDLLITELKRAPVETGRLAGAPLLR
jgi:hypothetical protein